MRRMVVIGGPVGCGQLVWQARLTCHRGILRLINRGLERSRRTGFSRRQSWTMAWAQLAFVASGGKIARL
jgi:hypothetical protein